MKACVFHGFGDEGKLHFETINEPLPQADQVQLRMSYAGVNPVDWKIREGYFKDAMEHRFPVIPGWDGSGVITAVGSQVQGVTVGDRVFGYFRDTCVQWGSYAEKSVIKATSIAKVPAHMSMQVAASLPVAALTAWQALFEFANLEKGQTVLICGASGGVGSMAVQFAHLQGATVIATSSAKNQHYVKSLGADWHIDYTKESVVGAVKRKYPDGVDVVMDLVGGAVTKEVVSLARKGGVFVSIVDRTVASYASDTLKSGFVFVYPNREQLTQIAAFYEEKKIQAPLIEELPLEQAEEAWKRVKAGHVVGKIVLRI